MIYETIEEAVAELKKHPGKTVRARSGDLTVELRTVSSPAVNGRLGDALASIGPWEGETTANGRFIRRKDEIDDYMRAERESWE